MYFYSTMPHGSGSIQAIPSQRVQICDEIIHLLLAQQKVERRHHVAAHHNALADPRIGRRFAAGQVFLVEINQRRPL